MRTTTTLLALALLGAALAAAEHVSAGFAAPVEAPAPAPERPLVQIAILLDDSGSMSGLIGQARAHLWDIVNQLVTTRRDGQRPRVQVALYHYGDTPALAAPLVPLTDDLDAVSQQLFSINGGGGTESCGQAIHNAVSQLAWSGSREDLKLIFIAGNEPFTQGSYDYRAACREAIAKGIQVNTIHCGSREEGLNGQWADGARLADGSFACIDQDRIAPAIAAPQDVELAELNQQLNGTYLAYGAQGSAMRLRQEMQDANAAASAPATAPAVLSARIAAKGSDVYRNASWDLVDAQREGAADVATMADADLPPELRGLTPERRREAVAAKQAERSAIQARIAELAKARTAFVADAEAKLAAQAGQQTLGQAMRAAIAEQAAKKGLK